MQSAAGYSRSSCSPAGWAGVCFALGEIALEEGVVAPGAAGVGAASAVGGGAAEAETASVAACVGTSSVETSSVEKRGQRLWYSHQGQSAIFFGANTVVDRISSMRAIVDSRSCRSSSGVRVEVRVRFLAT